MKRSHDEFRGGNPSKRMRHNNNNNERLSNATQLREPFRALRDPSDGSHHNSTCASSSCDVHQEDGTKAPPPPPQVRLLLHEKETDPRRLEQRQKQIDYGKNTLGYDRFCSLVPRERRRPRVHPMTPDKTAKVSKKAFDRMIRRWRQALHRFDPPELQQQTMAQDSNMHCPVMDVDVSTTTTTTSTISTTTSSTTKHPYDTSDKHEQDFIKPHQRSTPEQQFSDDSTTLDPDTEENDLKVAKSPPSPSIYEDFVDDDEFLLQDEDDDLL